MTFELYDIASVAAVSSYFIPLAIVLVKKMWKEPFFKWLALYWAWGGLINMTDIIPGFPKNISYYIGVSNNVIDIPLILIVLYHMCSSIYLKRFLGSALIIIVAAEAVCLSVNGFNFEALTYPVGFGILAILIAVSWELVRYTKKVEHSNRENARAVVYAALLFEFATFTLIYIFDYFVPDASQSDSFLIYYISSFIALVIASIGYLVFKKYQPARTIFVREQLIAIMD